jgi:HEAT repeat protein
MEPVWGGRSDSAGTLRANCAHALVACEGIANQDLLLLLVDLLVDADKSVRAEAVRAIAQIGELAIPVLRLRTLIPGEDPEVLSTCFRTLLEIDTAASIPFVARVLEQADDTAAEAAFALAETHRPEALQAFTHLHRSGGPAASDPWFTAILLTAVALTRLPAAVDYLIALIEQEDGQAPFAIEALAKASSVPGIRERLIRTVDDIGSPRLSKVLHDHLPANAV